MRFFFVDYLNYIYILRNAAWVEIEQSYKSLTESNSIVRSRPIKKLKLCWKNMKAKARVDFLKTQKGLNDLKQNAANQLTLDIYILT